MKQLQPDLWQGTLYSSGMLNTHSYFLVRPQGNVLFYNTGDAGDLEKIEERGGIEYQLLTHRDESGPSLKRIQEKFGSKLCCSAIEEAFIGKDAPVDLLIDENTEEFGNIEIYETPGHTNGSLCFFYKSPHGKSYLFTGDTIFQWNGAWKTFVLSSSGGSDTSLANSLLKLRVLDPDIIMSSGFIGTVSEVEVTGDEWITIIDTEIAKLKG